MPSGGAEVSLAGHCGFWNSSLFPSTQLRVSASPTPGELSLWAGWPLGWPGLLAGGRAVRICHHPIPGRKKQDTGLGLLDKVGQAWLGCSGVGP